MRASSAGVPGTRCAFQMQRVMAPVEARPPRPGGFLPGGSEHAPPSAVRDGGCRSRVAASYSRAASLHGAEILALLVWRQLTQFAEEPVFLLRGMMGNIYACGVSPACAV